MKKFWIEVLIIFLFSSLMHFVYEWSDNNFIVGLFSPVNESVFEHTKMVILPTILLFLIKKQDNYVTLFMNLGITIISIIVLYYTYSGILGYNILICDIVVLLIAIIIGNFVSLFNTLTFNRSFLLIILLIIFYIGMTINPFKINLFNDPITNTYGINNLS